MKKNSSPTKMSIPIIFAIVGALIIAMGLWGFITDMHFKKNAEKCTAVISDIESYSDDDGGWTYDVYVQYTVDGQDYEENLHYHTSGMYVGNEISIYYDPLNPYDILPSNSAISTLLRYGLFGAIFFLIGVFMLVSSMKKSKSAKDLRENGHRVYADISNVYLNTSYSENDIHPFAIECCWVHPSTGITYLFKSDHLWFDPGVILDTHSITTLPVYLDMENPKKYHVDVTGVIDRV